MYFNALVDRAWGSLLNSATKINTFWSPMPDVHHVILEGHDNINQPVILFNSCNYRRKLNSLNNYQRSHIPSISKPGFPAATGSDPSNPCGKPSPPSSAGGAGGSAGQEALQQNAYNTLCNSMISSNPNSMIANPHACTPLSSPIDINMDNNYDLFLYNTGCSKPCPSVYNAYTMSSSRKVPRGMVT